MGNVFLHGKGGSGGGLSFRVLGGTSAPSNPKENDIWVNTDVKITGYIFSATEPENMVDGAVWFSIGTSSLVAFNALKKNDLRVYPLSAKQMVSGTLTDKHAKSYQGGEWVNWWNGELFQDGNQFEAVTGGWEAMGFNTNGSWSPTVPELEIGDTMRLSLSKTAVNTYAGVAITKKKIDLSGWSTLHVFTKELALTKAGEYSSGAAVYVLTSNDNTKFLKDIAAATQVIHSATTAYTKTNVETNVDVSGLDGEYYVAIRIGLAPKSGGADIWADIGNILLLK